MRKKMCEINGKQYMIPSIAGNLWSMSTQAVTAACKKGIIKGAEKDSSGKWIIPGDATKPLSVKEIREVLIATLALKNYPSERAVCIENMRAVLNTYKYLFDIGYIESLTVLDVKTPWNCILSSKGMELVSNGKPASISWVDTLTTAIQVIASVITIVSGIR